MNLTPDLIAGFVGSVLVSGFDEPTPIPAFHHDLWELCCSKDRFVAAAAPRGHAKSTAVTLSYTLASVLFRESKFVIIVSDTEAQSTMFLGNIKQQLSTNEDLIALFGIKKGLKGVEFVKDTETDVIVALEDGYMFRIMAKGAEQKLRGMNWDNTRPDLIVCDDLENDELVQNKERREKFRRWFNAALLPSLSPKGKVRMVGTVLHMDSLLNSKMPQAWSKWTVVDGLKMYSTRPFQPWKAVKWQAHNEDFSKVLWPERFNKDYFEKLREDYRQQGLGDLYSQEYLNEPIDETLAFFKKKDFLPRTNEDKNKNLNYYITVDLAISEKETADYSVFLIAGMDEDRYLHIVDVIRERMDGREIVNTILELQERYKPIAIGIEEMQVSKAIGPFLREEMLKQGIFPSLHSLKTMNKDKIFRARSIQARLRARSIKFAKEEDWYGAFEDELSKFPRDKHDDQVDCFAYLGIMLDKLVEAPTREEIEDELWEEEYHSSSLMGRSVMTGY